MKIAILDDYQDAVRHLDCFYLLANHDVQVLNQTYSEDELVKRLQGVEVLVLIRERTWITSTLLERLPCLKLISQTGKVSQHIDPKLCAQYGVDVAEGVGSPVAPSELCWALIMAASRHIPAYVNQLQQGNWQSSGSLGLGRTLNGRTLGIWGYGKIGQRIAKFAQAFGMNVLVWGSASSREKAVQDGFDAAESKQAFFTQADIVSLHLRLNEVTKACVTSADLELMKADSLFVNTSRAELVEEGALYQTLLKHPSKQAAIDVYANEPATTANEPLLTLENVLASPHLGYVEQSSYELYFGKAFENVVQYAKGNPQNLVL
ncbi:D-2-hydroxyacid dehydrogenase family protein [Vibrio tritonius]|uniref:D-2-hydroxyacid dehydrogenase family protein n=1 Tax=Vibrio tritonius TaxID=1435069 RepID=A0ABS7YSM6_9VIBR|nr:D-2-hydroxyacid dehydrogenase family protein [Vibrio tritonius]MCA2018641.1 D-2-hydroxyacid dehydrogenase family protein [Vibrio tritonius]